ncbi:UvrD-helicase domain-containing protein [Halonatronum saccharophilum]|uniref:UvrD-helicase domain-containing protein n=1 Tax=Halonatronum saccharophilum TaxID=150060 RepID=UPI000485592A|nr:UvrD-helicase domain-containing protein [Halonatronum saccharophilum]
MDKAIVLSDSYIDSFDSLDKQSRKLIKKSLKKFALQEKGNGFQLHDLHRTDCDSSFKSIRINRDLRAILSQKGDKYIFLYVDHHDDAYDWAKNKYLDKSSFGSVFLYDDYKLKTYQAEEMSDEEINQFFDNRPSLLEDQGVTIKDLLKLDINQVHGEYLMQIKDEGKFLEFISFMPEEIQEGLIDIIAGEKSVAQVYNILIDNLLEEADSIEEGLEHKDSKRRFYTVEDIEELDHILDEGMDRWKLFLHPKQQEYVKKDYNGPTLIEGGPGTGKTVVGMHRAVHLAKNIFTQEDEKILFCTFSKKLATYIKGNMEELAEQKGVKGRIEVWGVDSLIYHLMKDYNLPRPIFDYKKLEELMEEIYLKMELPRSFYFYKSEYKEVIQRNNIKSLVEYLNVDRIGRGEPLYKKERRNVWTFMEKILEEKRIRGLIDYEDRAALLVEAMEKGDVGPRYNSIIVDEAQDLSPMKLKVLGGLVKAGKNNLMLLSDRNQRIFQLSSWKRDAGIDIVGRAYYLTLNYRTTEQIRRYADSQLISSQVDADYIREYKSLFRGPEPRVRSFDNHKEQYRYIVSQVRELLDSGIEGYQIAILTPTSGDFKKIEGILEYEGIPHTILKKSRYPKAGDGVSVTTLHGSKGLEFRAVIIANYSEVAQRVRREIPKEFYGQNDLKQIECVKYVACTRAREELFINYVSKS